MLNLCIFLGVETFWLAQNNEVKISKTDTMTNYDAS